MNMAPISEPKTMTPAHAATQKTRRAATWRSYSGLAARFWRITKAAPAARAMTDSPTTTVVLSGTGAKLMASTSAAIISTDRIPPRLSTGSEVSCTWAGTRKIARTKATAARGRVIRKTEPQ